ncbi:MAG: cytochrome ubiquinol oxidase subunit I, partial [Acetobacteraceae bacterium]|nr:cytochrome ubiquinol oxidase subunit I [Acetobacteraceae bacterium]
VQRFRRRLYASPLLWRAAVLMGPAGFMALLSGWTVTEVGRQPFTAYGLLRTAESASPIATPGVAASLAAFVVVYFIVFGAGFLYLLRLMARRPVAGEAGPPSGVPVRSAGITPMPAVAGAPAPAAGD